MGVCFRVFYSKNWPDYINYYQQLPFMLLLSKIALPHEPADSIKEGNRCTRSQNETPNASIQSLEVTEQIKPKAVNHQLLACPPSFENI